MIGDLKPLETFHSGDRVICVMPKDMLTVGTVYEVAHVVEGMIQLVGFPSFNWYPSRFVPACKPTPGPWVLDERTGATAVYQGPKIDCLEHVERFIMFWNRPITDQERTDWNFIIETCNDRRVL